MAEELYLFYRCHRAALRARLAIAHLRELSPRTPEKWPTWPGTTLGLQGQTPCASIAFLEREEIDERVPVVEATDDLGEQSGQ